MTKPSRRRLVFLLAMMSTLVLALLLALRPSGGVDQPLSYVIAEAQARRVERIEVRGDVLTVHLAGTEEPIRSRKESSSSIEGILRHNGVPIGADGVEVVVRGEGTSIVSLVLNFLPFILIGGLLFFMLRRMGGANNQAMAFGKSRAKMNLSTRPTVTFEDVAGQEEAKQELHEIVEFLKYPEKFSALGARIPHGVLLIGPPGTGKTMVARAVSGEAGVPFFHLSGSEFVEMFVGVGASRVRDLFKNAKENAPAIVFIDEIDAVGRQRGSGLGGGHDEREQALNQILVEMDGFDTEANVIVIAATNRPDVLDPALLRPGRFDRQVTLDLPDVRGRRQVLDVHVTGKPVDESISLDTIAKKTPGFSGADLANLVNEAAILAARRGKKRISMDELNEAVDRVIAGPERKSRVITEVEKKIIAYHEAGHTVAGYFSPRADIPFKVTIVARGMAGGSTRSLPSDDRRLQDRSYYEAMMTMALGGHVSEETVFGEMTTGAHDDIGKVTQIARAMVTQWGMSPRLGPRTFGKGEQATFLGRDISRGRDYSERTAEQIDDEVRRLVGEAHARCRAVIAEHRDTLDRLASRLMEVETVEGDDLLRLLGPVEGRPLPADGPTSSSGGRASPAPAVDASHEDDTPPRRAGLTWGPRPNSGAD